MSMSFVSKQDSHPASEQPEGGLCGAVSGEVLEVQEGPWAQEVLGDQEDLMQRTGDNI